MKKIFVAVLMIVLTANVNAQSGMPKELTCTEEAFNFSFSLGAKWKLGAPKMGPAELTRNWSDYIPGWSFKHNVVMPETPLFPLVGKPLNIEALNYPVNWQNYAPLPYCNNFSVIDKPYLRITWPQFQVPNPISAWTRTTIGVQTFVRAGGK